MRRPALVPAARRASRRAPRLLSLSLSLVLVLLAGLAGVRPAVVEADSFTVTNLNDSGPGSLRQAIDAANAVPGADTITFQPGLSGTIVLTPQTLAISDDLEIQGPGAAVITVLMVNTVDDSSASVFEHGNPNGTSTIDGLTISGGLEIFGGGIRNHFGTLIVSNSTISGNAATRGGGIYNNDGGTLIVRNSTISENTGGGTDASDGFGGGIYNNRGGTVIVSNSTFANNSALLDGGAIYNNGDTLSATLSVTNSTFSGNSAVGFGGGIYNFGASGTATITNSTFAGNTAGDDGGAVSNSGIAMTLRASIIDDADPFPCGGPAITSTLNVTQVADVQCLGLVADPLLGPLAANGGPTLTHLIAAGSPAIDLDTTCLDALGAPLTTDQRGVPRPQGAACDSGAVERAPLSGTLQGCLYAGSLSRLQPAAEGSTLDIQCGRGQPVALLTGDDPGVDGLHACLYAGSLSQVGPNAPLSCGRGQPVILPAGTDLYACLYAGRLSQVGTAQPLTCGRGQLVGFIAFLPSEQEVT